MRPIAANAALRPRQTAARSAGIGRDPDLARAVLAAERLDRGEILLDLGCGPSSSTISTAPQPAG